jgi:hypothetical protein
MTITNPKREAVWAGEVVGIDLRNRRYVWKAEAKDFNPCGQDRQQNQHDGCD